MQGAPYNARVILAHFPVSLRRVLRISQLLLHLAWGVALAGLIFPLLGPAQRDRRIMAWARRLLRVLGVRLQAHLGIVVSVFRRRSSTSVDELSEMKG